MNFLLIKSVISQSPKNLFVPFQLHGRLSTEARRSIHAAVALRASRRARTSQRPGPRRLQVRQQSGRVVATATA